jgi:DNA repair protein RadC
MGKEQYQQHSFLEDPQPTKEPRRRQLPPERQLREAIERYVDVPKLRRYTSDKEQLTEALKTGEIPEELTWILSMLATVLAPIDRDVVRSPHDIASHLMVRSGHLCQEEFNCVCLNTKNRVQKIHTVYRGSLNAAMIRVGEAFREPIKLNSAAVIFQHNHPSGFAEPSPEDVLITRELVAAGKLLDCEVLDHVVTGQGNWVSLRERGLGFDKP